MEWSAIFPSFFQVIQIKFAASKYSSNWNNLLGSSVLHNIYSLTFNATFSAVFDFLLTFPFVPLERIKSNPFKCRPSVSSSCCSFVLLLLLYTFILMTISVQQSVHQLLNLRQPVAGLLFLSVHLLNSRAIVTGRLREWVTDWVHSRTKDRKSMLSIRI